MTIEQGFEQADYEQQQSPDAWAEQEPIPVKIKAGLSERVAPESTSFMSYTVPVLGSALQPVQLLPHKYHRYKAKFLWIIPANATVYLDRVPDHLMSGALGLAFQLITGATAITNSAVVLPEYDGQQPLYAIASVAGVTVSVMDESYKAVQ